jgi:hypothetical protein
LKLEDVIRERDECSKAGMELIELCRRLIEAEAQIAKIIKGKGLK